MPRVHGISRQSLGPSIRPLSKSSLDQVEFSADSFSVALVTTRRRDAVMASDPAVQSHPTNDTHDETTALPGMMTATTIPTPKPTSHPAAEWLYHRLVASNHPTPLTMSLEIVSILQSYPMESTSAKKLQQALFAVVKSNLAVRSSSGGGGGASSGGASGRMDLDLVFEVCERREELSDASVEGALRVVAEREEKRRAAAADGDNDTVAVGDDDAADSADAGDGETENSAAVDDNNGGEAHSTAAHSSITTSLDKLSMEPNSNQAPIESKDQQITTVDSETPSNPPQPLTMEPSIIRKKPRSRHKKRKDVNHNLNLTTSDAASSDHFIGDVRVEGDALLGDGLVGGAMAETTESTAIKPTEMKSDATITAMNKEASTITAMDEAPSPDKTEESLEQTEAISMTAAKALIELSSPKRNNIATSSSVANGDGGNLHPVKPLQTLPPQTNYFSPTMSPQNTNHLPATTTTTTSTPNQPDFPIQPTLEMKDDIQWSFQPTEEQLAQIQKDNNTKHASPRRVTRSMDASSVECVKSDKEEKDGTISAVHDNDLESPSGSKCSPLKTKPPTAASSCKNSDKDNVAETDEKESTSSQCGSTQSSKRSVVFDQLEIANDSTLRGNSIQQAREKKQSPTPRKQSPKASKSINSPPKKNSSNQELERKSDSSSWMNRPRRKRGEGQIRIMFTGFNPTQRNKEVRVSIDGSDELVWIIFQYFIYRQHTDFFPTTHE